MKPRSFSQPPLTNQSNTFEIIKLLTVALLLLLFTPLITSQSCGMSEAMLPPANCRHGLPHPDCTLSGRSIKCVKVKFHYINNTASSPTPPSEAHLGYVLEYINQKYKSSKIHFTTDGECLHIGTVNPEYNTGPEFYDLLDVVNDEVTSTDPELGYIHGYINIYIVQSLQGANYGYPYISTVVTVNGLLATPVLIHEIGHTLGLSHTHDGPVNPTIPQDDTGICKDVNATDPITEIPYCETVQDCLCDTGPDPWVMDIDGNDLPDKSQWVVNGAQSPDLDPGYSDWCDDKTTPWNIPARNYMSYYSIRDTFSLCQRALMHDFLTQLKPDLLLNCNQEDPYLGCEDIVITSPTIWQNQIVELCWKQNIIIEKTGSLKLINTKLTISDPPPGSQSCPDIAQIHAWGGIYIEGRGVVNDIPPILTGNLYVESGSIIERSHYGISAPYGFGEIIISNSTIQNSGRFIYAIGRFDPTDIQTSLPL